MKTTTLWISVSWLALATASAWASGNDHFNAGIDAGGCSACGGSFTDSTGGSFSDVDHEGGRLTDSDRAMVASLVGGAWGTLVSVANGQAKFATEMHNGGTSYRTIDIPASKPAPPPRPVARRAVPAAPQPAAPTTPAYDMGTISAPPLEGPAWSPVPEQANTITAVNLPSAQIDLPVRSAPRRTGYAGLEQTIRARIPVDTRLPGARLRRKGEEATAAAVNAAIGFGYGAAFGAKPGGGKVFSHGTLAGMVENGALVALAGEARRRRNGGVTPFDADVRNALNLNDRQVRALARDMEGNMTPRQVEQFTRAFKEDRHQYQARERAAARNDNRQREHGR